MTYYSREDVTTRGDDPAVNVKVRGTIHDAGVWDAFRKDEGPDEGFTLEWIEENISDERLDAIFWQTCESEYEYLERWATGADDDPLFPDDRVTLSQEGRSGGWIVVHGLPDLGEWDAVRLSRWRRFERIAHDIAQGVPIVMLSSIYINEWEWARKEREERDRAARQDIATVAAA